MPTGQHRQTTRAVFEDHLCLRRDGGTEADIEANYADDLVVLSGTGIHRGRDGVRETARMLNKFLPRATFEYRNTLVEGDYAFLEWAAIAEDGHQVCDGADSFVIRDGKIVFQSIHYTVSEQGE